MTAKELTQIKEDIDDRLKRRNDENDRLKDDLKTQVDELHLLRSRHRESQIALADSQSQLLPLQFEVTKLQRELEAQRNQAEDLQVSIHTNRMSTNCYSTIYTYITYIV